MQFLDTHQGSLIAAFGVYSTALFLLLSMRLTSVRYYNDGVLAFSDVCADEQSDGAVRASVQITYIFFDFAEE